MSTNQMPHSSDAELAIIASAIVDPSLMIKLGEVLQPEYFYNKINEHVFQALVDLHKKNRNIDIITLKEQLANNDVLHLIPDYGEYISIAEDITIAINIDEYSRIVYEKYLIRQTINKAKDILSEGYTTDDSSSLIEFAETEIFSLAKMTRSEEFVNWDNLLTEVEQNLIELMNSDKNQMTGLATGFSNLDKLTNGLQKTDLIILAARPSVGKTAFALNIARGVLRNRANNNPSVAFFSLEMSADQLSTRMLAMQSNVPISDIRTGNIKENLSDVKMGMDSLRTWNFHVDETPGIKIGEIKSKARKLAVEKDLDLIIIDYLQLITTATNHGENRQQEVSEISRELKGLAKSLKVPIVALSQLSRGVESRADKRPMMSDIRESGAIEQDADIIMMLYRPDYYGNNIELEEEVVEGQTTLIVSKHRNGPTGDLEYIFKKEINTFEVVDYRYD